jgi:phosphate butyryltransferase
VYVLRNFDELVLEAQKRPPARVAVAAADDADVLGALKQAADLGLAEGIFAGDKNLIEKIAGQVGLDLTKHTVIHATDRNEAAKLAVKAVRDGEAQILMKGFIQTGDIMRAVLDKEVGLRTGKALSHIAVVETSNYHKLALVSDGGLNIAPDLQRKIEITQNVIDMAIKLGVAVPKIAVLSALELVNPDMPSTMDAALICRAAQRGQIKGGIVDGPLAMDGAISKEAAEHKKIVSDVTGDPDGLIVPNIETGNVLLKGLQYMTGALWAGVVVGAKAPVIVLSRADHAKAKMLAIAVSRLLV